MRIPELVPTGVGVFLCAQLVEEGLTLPALGRWWGDGPTVIFTNLFSVPTQLVQVKNLASSQTCASTHLFLLGD